MERIAGLDAMPHENQPIESKAAQALPIPARRRPLDKRTRSARIVLDCYFFAQLGMLYDLIDHASVNPAVMGRYSVSYLFLMALYAVGVAASIILLRLCNRRDKPVTSLFRHAGFTLGTAAWWGAMLMAGKVYVASDDTEFRHFAYLLFVCWPVAALLWSNARPALQRAADKLAVSAAAVCLMLLLAEFALHALPLAGASVRQYRRDQLNYLAFHEDADSIAQGYQSTLTTDPELGWKPLPNLKRELKSVNGELAGWSASTNAWGYGGANLDIAKSYPIVAVGDSFTAYGWPEVLSAETGWDVANLGVPGYCPTQYNVVIRRHALKLHPSCIIYGLYLNDACDCAQFEKWQKSGQDWFAFMGGMWFGAPPAHPGRGELKKLLLRVSWLYTLADYALFAHREKSVGFLDRPIEYEKNGAKITFDRDSFERLANVDSPEVKRGLEIIKQRLVEARENCSNAGVSLLVIIYPSKEWAYYDALMAAAKPQDRPGIERLPRFQAALTQICKDAGVDYFDPTDRFRAKIRDAKAVPYRPIDIHWNETGNALMADAARGEIEKRFPDLAAAAKPSPGAR